MPAREEPGIRLWLGQLTAPDPEVRARAASELAFAGARLGQERPTAPRSGTEGELDALRAKVIGELIERLQDEAAIVRSEAVAALGEWASREVVPHIAQHLAGEQSPEVKRSWIRTVGGLGGMDVFNVLKPFAFDGDVVVRQEATDYMMRILAEDRRLQNQPAEEGEAAGSRRKRGRGHEPSRSAQRPEPAGPSDELRDELVRAFEAEDDPLVRWQLKQSLRHLGNEQAKSVE